MAELIENNENPNFRLKAIAEFLDGNHHFYIPSYQRGYRWIKKQVDDLLKDIWDFAKDAKKGDFYCLQPIVVKNKEWNKSKDEVVKGWEVIDGQQRLSTILLLLKYLVNNSDDARNSSAIFYDIYYKTRPALNFDNPKIDTDIDSFHAFYAKQVIEKWFSENMVRKSKIVEVLFYDYSIENKLKPQKEWEPQVKFIWYVAENNSIIDSIKIFNNLNRGKIRLTNAELIKALFILKAKGNSNSEIEDLNLNELSYEWNEIENTLQDNTFWYFLANKDYNPSTRIDIIFDFLTEKGDKDDSDYAYRRFQDLFDSTNDLFWSKKEISNFTEAWKKVKDVFHTFLYWYEDSTLYHYIGFLVLNKTKISDIYNSFGNLSKSEMIKKLQIFISNKILNIKKEDIDALSYSENGDKKIISNILLFFNLETCVIQQRNQNKNAQNLDSITYYKFPFDLFKLNEWDIEHVGSQKENLLIGIKDKIIWLKYIDNIESDDINWTALKSRALELILILEEKKKDDGEFKKLYDDICLVIQKSKNDTKDSINNLTLLDAGTNRGYGNALFPTKRQIIIENDMKGIFVSVCTRNLFLKYYSKNEQNTSQWRNTWEDNDRQQYLSAIHKTIDYILK